MLDLPRFNENNYLLFKDYRFTLRDINRGSMVIIAKGLLFNKWFLKWAPVFLLAVFYTICRQNNGFP